jgi:hypothetical protein
MYSSRFEQAVEPQIPKSSEQVAWSRVLIMLICILKLVRNLSSLSNAYISIVKSLYNFKVKKCKNKTS